MLEVGGTCNGSLQRQVSSGRGGRSLRSQPLFEFAGRVDRCDARQAAMLSPFGGAAARAAAPGSARFFHGGRCRARASVL